jgi:hypothetical protein
MEVLTATPEAPAAGVMDVTAGADGGVIVPELALDPPHPETARTNDTKRNAYQKRMVKHLIYLLWAERCPSSRLPGARQS